jgi:hypothetical protein
MLDKFKEIANAWIISYNPSNDQKILAENRFTVCDICPSKKVLSDKIKISTICGECGCPISKKIFSPEFNACPLKKWENIDKIFYPNTQKKSKTVL